MKKNSSQSQQLSAQSTNLNQLQPPGDPRSIILSAIDCNQQQIQPQLLRIKNNILLGLLALSAYGIYYVIGDFIDYLIIGYITGLAYHQTRTKFTRFILNYKYYSRKSQQFPTRLCKAFFLVLFVFVLPRFRYMLIYPYEFRHSLNFNNYIDSFYRNNSITVIICQIIAVLYATYLLLVPYLKRIGQKIKPKSKRFIQFMFGFFVLLLTLTAIILIPVVLFKQVGQVGFLIQQKVQQKLQCQIISYGSHSNKTLPSCSQKVVQNSLIKQTIQQFRNQNQTVEKCKQYIKNLQLDYIGHNVFHYDQITCTWYSFAAKAANYSAIHSQTQDISTASIFSTGTNIFKDVFGNLTKILLGISNFIFYFTIWITTFMLTTNLPNRYMTIKTLFSQNKAQFVSGITKLINAICMIVFWHFFASIILLELFHFTPINLIVSICLSLMAFIPLFRPWFGILLVSAIRTIFLHQYSQHFISLVFIGIYYTVSQYIYSFYYRKLQFHQIITNLSVLFGIYRFGISGIFYGPLIVILYNCVQKQLLSNYKSESLSNKSISGQENTMKKIKSSKQNDKRISYSHKNAVQRTETMNSGKTSQKSRKKMNKKQSQQYYLSHGQSSSDIQQPNQTQKIQQLMQQYQKQDQQQNQISMQQIIKNTNQNTIKNKKKKQKKFVKIQSLNKQEGSSNVIRQKQSQKVVQRDKNQQKKNTNFTKQLFKDFKSKNK